MKLFMYFLTIRCSQWQLQAAPDRLRPEIKPTGCGRGWSITARKSLDPISDVEEPYSKKYPIRVSSVVAFTSVTASTNARRLMLTMSIIGASIGDDEAGWWQKHRVGPLDLAE